jgi:LysR family cyn operon transcriptional activator
MELRHLRYFLKIAETSSFTQAAKALNITQPTLSHQIKQLEEEIGTPLFDRAGRTVQLTAQGAVFKTCAEGALREIEQGLTALSELEGLVRGTVTIGVFRSFSSSLLPPVLARFSRPSDSARVI